MAGAPQRVVLLLVLATLHHLHAATLSSLPSRGSALGRLRGGDLDIDLEEDLEDEMPVEGEPPSNGAGVPAPKALTREEIMEKLNVVPVFCILNKDNGVVGMRMKDGSDKPSVCWFTDALEARALLEAAAKCGNGDSRPRPPHLHV